MPSLTPWNRESLRRRGAGLLLAAAFELAVILLLLLFLAPAFTERKAPVPMSVFGVEAPGEAERPEKTRAEARAKPAGKANARRERAVEPPPPPPQPADASQAYDGPPQFVRLTRSDYNNGDIANAPAAAPAARPESGGSGGAGDSAVAGRGPRGQTLYSAEWYRRPRDAELAPFLGRARAGWGEIICRTAPRYRVEDCQEIGESPGSGIAGAIRQASFQFLVRPPRKNGQDMVGEWVTIHFDYTITRK